MAGTPADHRFTCSLESLPVVSGSSMRSLISSATRSRIASVLPLLFKAAVPFALEPQSG